MTGPETPEGLDLLGRAVAAMEALPGEVEKARRDFTERTDAINRRAKFWIVGLSAGVATATGAAVTALVVLFGTVGDVRDSQATIAAQQETIAAQQLAACGFHRGWVEIPAAAASAQAARTPGATPSPNPYLNALVAGSATAYNQGGCVPRYGPLPTFEPQAGATPTPSG